jgi:hypothetical integral membrane protein (TIGR02206 family)
MPQPFVPFGRAHLIATALAFVVPVALATLTRPLSRAHWERRVRLALASLLILNWAFWMWLLYQRGWLSLASVLPLNLCDWATIAAVAALIVPNQRSYELAYFWALGGTLQGMMTPDIVYDFPDTQFILFFVYHSGIIASVLYLTFGCGLRPVPQSIPRVIAWSFGYLAAAGLADWLLGTNYGFLRAKPDFATVLGFLAPWPYYILELIVLGLVSVALYYAPFYVFDVWRARRAARLSAPKPAAAP